MRKTLLLTLVPLFLSACTQDTATVFAYSDGFKLTFPKDLLHGATVFAADELSLKTREGVVFSGKVISADSERLPSTLDIRKFPDYLLKLQPIQGLKPELRDPLMNARRAIGFAYDLDRVTVIDQSAYKIYQLCSERESCLAYVVKTDLPDHILMIQAKGLSDSRFHQLLQSGLDVNH